MQAGKPRSVPQISYTPKVLRSMAEICEVMGVGAKTVKAWAQKGAPIAVEGEGKKVRYSAESARLQIWREGIGAKGITRRATAGADAADG